MAETMNFPNDWAEFLEDYSFRDHKEFYTNGARLIPTFRVKQMMEHYLRKAVADKNVGCKWIPVTERLPEDDTRVLVYIRDGYGGNEMIDTDRCHNGRWVRWNKFISHWAPISISAPPEGE